MACTRREWLYLLAAADPARAAADRVRVTNSTGEKVVFSYRERPLFDYRYSPARPKTYVHPFYAPGGRDAD